MYEGITSNDKQKKDKHTQEYFGLFAVASDAVLDSTGALWLYLKDTQGTPRSQEKVDELFIAMFKAMREDCFEPTKLSDERIAEVFPLEV